MEDHSEIQDEIKLDYKNFNRPNPRITPLSTHTSTYTTIGVSQANNIFSSDDSRYASISHEQPRATIDNSRIDNGLRKAIRNNSSDASYSMHIINETRAYADHLCSLLEKQLDVVFKKDEDVYLQLRSGWVLANILNCLKFGCIDLNKIFRVDERFDVNEIKELGDMSLIGKMNSPIYSKINEFLTLNDKDTPYKSINEEFGDKNMPLSPVRRIRNTEQKSIIFEIHSNLVYILNVASNIGLKLINIGAEDILNSNKSLVLGLLWQIVRYSLTKSSNVLRRPELINLKEGNESIGDLNILTPEELCLRWINYHLEMAQKEEYIYRIRNLSIGNDCDFERREGEIQSINEVFKKCYNSQNAAHNKNTNPISNAHKMDANGNDKHLPYLSQSEQQNKTKLFDNIPNKCRNFTSDIKDSKIYLILLRQIAPDKIDIKDVIKGWIQDDLEKRASIVLELAERLGCQKFVTPKEICEGDHRLNFLFSQTLMNGYLGFSSNDEIFKKVSGEIEKYEKEIKEIYEKVKLLTHKHENKIEDSSNQNKKNDNQRNNNDDEMKHKYKTNTEEYECMIKDLKASINVFSYKIENYVEETVGIKLSKTERCDAKERLLTLITKLMTEIKVLQSEKNEAIQKLEKKMEIDRLMDNKMLEYVSIQKKNNQKKKRKSGCFLNDLFNCK